MKVFAYLVRRFFAFGADWYISAILINLIANALSHFIGIYAGLIVASLVVPFIYYVIVPIKVFNGSTLLQRAMVLRVVKSDDSAATIKDMVIRYYVGCLLLEGMYYVPSTNIRLSLGYLIPSLTSVLVAINYVVMVISILSLISALLDYKSKEFKFIHDRLAHTKVTDSLKIS